MQVTPWQQCGVTRDVERVTGELHRVFRSTDRGGTDAFPGGQQQPRQSSRVQLTTQCAPETAAEVAEVAALPVIDVLRDAAGEHDSVDRSNIGQRVRQVELTYFCRRIGCRRVGIAHRTEHRGRHRFAQHIERRGIDLIAE